MCIIIDANVANEFSPLTDAARGIFEWVTEGGRIVSGGRLKAELLKTKFRLLYQPLLLAGRLIEYEKTAVDQSEKELVDSGICNSDDPHVIALARISDARILFSRDMQLHADFCNRSLLRPRGRVYQNQSHTHILRSARKCRRL